MSSGASSDDLTCTCVTEQGTKVQIRLNHCARLALHGPEYNPYKEPREDRQTSSESAPVMANAGSASSAPADVVIGVGQRPMSTFPESVQNRYSGN